MWFKAAEVWMDGIIACSKFMKSINLIHKAFGITYGFHKAHKCCTYAFVHDFDTLVDKMCSLSAEFIDL